MLFTYLAHRRACALKQDERKQRIRDLEPVFHEPITPEDKSLLSQPISQVVSNVRCGQWNPVKVLVAYSKHALAAHKQTNCLTEILIQDAVGWARDCNREGPLAGVPVSMKDTVCVKGYDNCIGYSAWVGQPATKDSALVRLLRDAGAVPFVKTNVPITLMSFESASDVWGRTTNPHKSTHSAGGSTGGEAALLAFGGSRIGVGTDVAGSVRVPAHYSGIYTIKCSTGRFPKMGSGTSMPGQEGVPPVYSPMARTLEDLEFFWKAVVGMKPWTYDHTCHPIPWRPVEFREEGKPKWGIMWDDGVTRLSPACQRALQTVVDALRRAGHDVYDVHPPDPYEGQQIGSRLILADAGKTCTAPIRYHIETNDAGMVQALRMFRLPSWLRRLYTWYIRHIRRDEVYAGFLEGWREKSVPEFWATVAKREAYKAQWFEWWNEKEKIDFLITAPNALPAVPHEGMKDAFSSCGYSFLFNVLDYSAGVLPVTHVDSNLDQLPAHFTATNAIERGAYQLYDAKQMNGLPVGVQIVGQRLEEEKVMEGMKIVEDVLRKEGLQYALLNQGE